MGKIRKILETELVGGTQSTDVYPVTSTKAVYDTNNKVLDDYIQHLKKTSTFAGIATPTTNPDTPDGPVFYIAGEGTYVNFSNLVIGVGQLGILKWNGTWSKEVLEIGAGGGSGSGSGVSLGTLLAQLNSDNPFPTANGQVLTYNGSNFIWKIPTGGSGITLSPVMNAMNNQLGKTTLNTPQFLYWDGSTYTWKNESEISGGSGSSSRIKKIKLFTNNSDYPFETIELGTADTIGFMAGNNVSLEAVVKEFTNVIKISATGGSGSGGSGGSTSTSVSWEDVTNKPSTFTPSSHTHSADDITNFVSTVKGITVDNAKNAESANKLASSVYLWGNSFNGVRNIGSAASNTADLRYVNNIYTGNTFGLYNTVNGIDTSLLSIDNTPNISVAYGYRSNENAILSLFGNKTKIYTNGQNYHFDFVRNVFDVNSNQIHFGSETNGGKISWDAANNAFKIEGNVYATGGITALGVSNNATTSNNVDFTFNSVTSKRNIIYAVDNAPFKIYPKNNTNTPLIFSHNGVNWNIYDDDTNDIHLQGSCTIDSDGWVFSPKFLSNENGRMSLDGSSFYLGDTNNNVNVVFTYNGSKYRLDMSRAISVGVFTMLSTQELSALQERNTNKKAVL